MSGERGELRACATWIVKPDKTFVAEAGPEIIALSGAEKVLRVFSALAV